jgi:phage terminase large subunit GpA-like protein
MRSLKILGMLLCVVVLGSIALAAANNMGIREVREITFSTPMRVGASLLPAGQYVVRHTMEGQEHVMVFQRASNKEEFKVKCTLVPLAQKADETRKVYEINAAKENVLQELVFRGDTAKHVF